MMRFLDAAILDLKGISEGGVIGAVNVLDFENMPPRPIALFTRYALTASGSVDFVRKIERLQNIPD